MPLSHLTPEDSSSAPSPLSGCEDAIDGLRAVGALFYWRGWSVGTSSNYSVVLRRDPLELAITASGMDKGQLKRCDFVRVDGQGSPTADGQPKSSAETLLHCVAARQKEVGAVLHTHSVWATVLSEHFAPNGSVNISGYEMLKGLAGVSTHQHTERLEIFDNTQDIPSLARMVEQRMENDDNPLQHGYLIRQHGLYTWGADLSETRRHVEVFEFLLECIARDLMLKGLLPPV